MSNRVLIFDDDQAIREILWSLFDRRGYEVFTFPHPGVCPLSDAVSCPCPGEQSCSDLIVSDMEMPYLNGLDFIEQQIGKGCRCRNIALISGSFTEEHRVKAAKLGIMTFDKPFRLAEFKKWLEQVEAGIKPDRILADWHLKGLANPKD